MHRNLSFVLAVALLAITACTRQTPAVAGTPSVEVEYPAAAVGAAVPAASASAAPVVATSPPAMLDKVFDPEMLDVDVAYFEKTAGVPRRSEGDRREYRIDNCDVAVALLDGRVRNMRLGLKDGCSVDLNRFLLDYGIPPANQLTFGSFMRAVGSNVVWYADCLGNCGNAYDPSVYLDWTAPRANLVYTVQLEGMALGGTDWEGTMERENGNDWVMEGRFNCFDDALKYREIASKVYAEEKPIAVSIGWDVPVPKCPTG